MAYSLTPHYSLKKPAGTDKPKVADLNSNMDTLDTVVYGIEQDVNTLESNLKSCVSLSNQTTEDGLANALNLQIANMANYEVRNLQVYFTGDATDNFSHNVRYACTLYRGSSSSYAHVTCRGYSSADVVEGAYSGGDWTFYKLVRRRTNALVSGLTINNTTESTTTHTIAYGDGNNPSEQNAGGIMFNKDARQFYFRTYGKTNRRTENFYLPANNNDNTATGTYDIVTTKDYDFLTKLSRFTAQSPSDAGVENSVEFTAPANNMHALIGFNGNFVHLYYNTPGATNILHSGLPDEYSLTKNGATYKLIRSRAGSSYTFNVHILWY